MKKCPRILKDGDMVEVDADNGIVRLLKNKTGESSSLVVTLFTVDNHLLRVRRLYETQSNHLSRNRDR